MDSTFGQKFLAYLKKKEKKIKGKAKKRRENQQDANEKQAIRQIAHILLLT